MLCQYSLCHFVIELAELQLERMMSTVHYLVGFLVVVLAVRADERQFYLRHVEFTRLVVATDGNALIARYTEDPATDALMFKEDPRTQNIITVDGELCITDDSGDSGTPPSDIISYIVLGRACHGVI